MLELTTGVITRRGLIGALAGTGAVALAGGWSRPLYAADAVATTRWSRVDAVMASYVDEHKTAGMVGAFGFGDAAPAVIAYGGLALGPSRPVDADSLFRVYSMTKPITGIAAMMLVEEGKLRLDQPIADFIPEMAHMTVLTDPEHSLDARPAKAPITLRHLMTHTAGLGYTIVTKGPLLEAYLKQGINPAIVSRMALPGLPVPAPTPGPDAFLRRLGQLPLIADPGTKWSYSIGLDVTGLLIGRVSGMAFGDFLHERLFAPLGMTSSFFQVPAKDAGRLTTDYAVFNGQLIPVDPGATSIYLDPTPFAYGGAGLVSTPRDYDRFLAMLLNGGMLNGKRILAPQTVALATSNLLPPGVSFAPGWGFGAGGRVGLGPRAGQFGWEGAAGTIAFIDTARQLRAGGFVQYLPAQAYPFQDAFRTAALADAV